MPYRFSAMNLLFKVIKTWKNETPTPKQAVDRWLRFSEGYLRIVDFYMVFSVCNRRQAGDGGVRVVSASRFDLDLIAPVLIFFIHDPSGLIWSPGASG